MLSLSHILNQNVLVAQVCVGKSSMTPGCHFLHGQRIQRLLLLEKHSMKSIFIGVKMKGSR